MMHRVEMPELANAVKLAIVVATMGAGLIPLRHKLHHLRGLSGLDSALFVLAALSYGRNAQHCNDRKCLFVALGVAAAFLGKIAYESPSSGTLFVDAASGRFELLPLSLLLSAAAKIAVAVNPD